MKNTCVLLVLLGVFSNCNSPVLYSKGHWHSIIDSSGNYLTLDVTDSLLIIDNFSIRDTKQIFIRTTVENEVLEYPFLDTINLTLKNGLLELENFGTFKKYEHMGNHMSDYFCNTTVRVNLPQSSHNSSAVDISGKKITDIYIGPSKFSEISTNWMNPDSSYIQVLDVIIDDSELLDFAQLESQKWSGGTFSVVIHADSTVSENTVNSMIHILNPLSYINDLFVSEYNYELDKMLFFDINTAGNKP